MSQEINTQAWNDFMGDSRQDAEEDRVIIREDPDSMSIYAVVPGSDKKYKIYVEVFEDSDDDPESFSQSSRKQKVKVEWWNPSQAAMEQEDVGVQFISLIQVN